MKISKIQKGLVLISMSAGMFAVGCELIVDFDRTKIPVEITEASIPDVVTPDGYVPIDASGTETSTADADAGSTVDAADAADDADADQ